MKSLLKKLTVLVSVLMVALALTGCSQDNKPAATDVPVVEAPAGEETPVNP